MLYEFSIDGIGVPIQADTPQLLMQRKDGGGTDGKATAENSQNANATSAKSGLNGLHRWKLVKKEDPMSDAVAVAPAPQQSILDSKLKHSSPGKIGAVIFALMLLAGAIYIITAIAGDLQSGHPTSIFPFFLLGLALLIALGFEFVNGFHDTANAVATVIYTHSLEPHIAVVWSGCWNFLGVLTSSGAVAYAIVSLLPAELILKVSSGAGFAMVFALLVAAIIWNLLTWFFWPARLQLTHHDRLHHRRRYHEPDTARALRRKRRELGPGDQRYSRRCLYPLS